MRFVKMHGIGNDYVYVDAFAERVDDPVRLARAVASRQFGIGSDGLILIGPASTGSNADVRMRMFNADGSESEMCGNGVRCVAKFAIDRGLARANPLRVQTGRGVLSVAWHRGGDGTVARATVDMGAPILDAASIPVVLSGVGATDAVVAHPFAMGEFGHDAEWIARAGLELAVTCVSMGNPHAIFYTTDVSGIPLERVGPVLERHRAFPNRINVHFVEVLAPDEVVMRTWERGSGVTLACGTGASAVCVAGVLTGKTLIEIRAHLPGGDLDLKWAGEGGHVFMTGPATKVFEGDLDRAWLDLVGAGAPLDAAVRR